MIGRLLESLIAILRATDIWLCTWWLAPLYVLGLADKPSGRQMISSYIGKGQVYGRAWARIAGGIIDRAAMLLGDKPNHCLRAYRHYRGLDQ
jgi:hypothetical protein